MQYTPIIPTARRGSTAGHSTRSPLRWPGGKSKIAKTLIKFLPTLPSTLFSPFIGGASVELLAASLGWRVTGTDASPDVVAFWRVLLKTPEALADAVELHHPISRAEFYELQQSKPKDDFDRAVALFVVNRSSFGGSTYSGGYCLGRFTQSSIDRLRNFHAPNLHVEPPQDFRESIPQHDSSYLYIDAPYPGVNGYLYGRGGALHRAFDLRAHEDLRELLKGREGVMLSYPDLPEVRHWYRNWTIVTIQFNWGIGTQKLGNELLILSPDLAALVQNSTE